MLFHKILFIEFWYCISQNQLVLFWANFSRVLCLFTLNMINNFCLILFIISHSIKIFGEKVKNSVSSSNILRTQVNDIIQKVYISSLIFFKLLYFLFQFFIDKLVRNFRDFDCSRSLLFHELFKLVTPFICSNFNILLRNFFSI